MTHLLTLSLLLTTIFSSTQESPAEKTEEEKNIQATIERLNSSRDAKFLAVLEMEPFYEEMNDEQKAEFGYVLFDEIYNSFRDHTFEEYIQGETLPYIDFSIQYFTRTKEKSRLIMSYILKGRSFQEKRDYTNASYTFLEGLDIAVQEKNPEMLGIIYFHLARLAGYQDEFEKALTYADLSIGYFKEADKQENVATLHTVKSWIHQANVEYNLSLKSSFEALKYTRDSTLTGEILNTIGVTYNHLNRHDSALYYMNKSLEFPCLAANLSVRFYHLAEVHNSLKDNNKALYFLNQALNHPIDIYFRRDCYALLRKIALEENEEERAQFYTKRFQTCQDSIRKLTSQPNIHMIEQIHQLDKQAAKAKTDRFYLLTILLILTTIGIILIIYLYRKHQQKDKEAKNYRNELEEKEGIIDTQQEEFGKRHELLLQDITEELKRTKEKYAIQRAKSNYEQRCEIDKRIYNEVFHLENENTFTIKMNHILNGLPDKLKTDYPGITHKEIIYCCLFMLDLSTNELSFIMDYKQSSLYKFKQRLTKKLGFDTVKDLESMLNNKVNI